MYFEFHVNGILALSNIQKNKLGVNKGKGSDVSILWTEQPFVFCCCCCCCFRLWSVQSLWNLCHSNKGNFWAEGSQSRVFRLHCPIPEYYLRWLKLFSSMMQVHITSQEICTQFWCERGLAWCFATRHRLLWLDSNAAVLIHNIQSESSSINCEIVLLGYDGKGKYMLAFPQIHISWQGCMAFHTWVWYDGTL